MTKQEENINSVKEILDDEIRGNFESALKKMHSDYSVVWMDHSTQGNIRIKSIKDNDFMDLMKQAYKIKGRNYNIQNIVAGGDVVMVECIEEYNDEKRTYKTPLVLVIIFKDGKIWKSRHYCDRDLSFENIDDINKKIGLVY